MCTVTIALLSVAIGYYLGKSSGLRKAENISDLKQRTPAGVQPDDEFVPPSTSDDEWEEAAGDSDAEENGEIKKYESSTEDCKMVFVVRTDLGMTKGKIAAQCGHAALACYKAALRNAPGLVRRWETLGQTKVAVQVKSEEELIVLQAQAASLGVVARVVHDAGRTQIAAGSATVLGLGPAPRSVIDAVSGGLKLL